MHFQEHLLIPVIDSIRPFEEFSKRYTCCIKNCGRFIESRKLGLCQTHILRYKKGHDLLKPIREIKKYDFCSVSRCRNKCRAKSLCSKHYQRKIKHGDSTINFKARGRRCSVSNCFNKHERHGFCIKHAHKFIKYGDPLFKILEDRGTYINCSIKDCNNKYYAKSYCSKHYYLYIFKQKVYYRSIQG